MGSRPIIPKFFELIEEIYEKEDAKHAEKAPEGYRHNPSSATMLTDGGKVVGSCLRALYYKAVKHPHSDKKPLTTKLQGDFGNGIHDRFYTLLKKSEKIKLTSELPGKVTVDPLTQEVSYRLDGVVDHKGESGYLEIKTMQSYGLQKMVRAGIPRDKDILQVLVGLGVNPELRWGALMYVGRDNAYRAEYHIFRDPTHNEYMIEGIVPEFRPKLLRDLSFKKVVERWKELEGHVERAEVPKRDFKAVLREDGTVTDKRTRNHVDYETDSACKWCPWKTYCWSLPDAKEECVQLD